MTSFGPDFSKLIDGTKTTPNPGIHQEGGPTGSSIPGNLPVTSDQIKTVSKGISGGVVRDVAVALGNVVVSVGDIFDDAFDALSDWGNSVLNRFKAFFNGWFGGSGGTGTEAEVTYVIESIKDAVINGYTVTTFTSDTAAWTVPAHVEMVSVIIGGGQSGSGTSGGLHGSYKAAPIDLTGITSLDIKIGTAGNLSYVREANGTPHTGTIIDQSPPHGSDGGVAGTFGLTKTSSTPGSGGHGGAGGGSSTDGDPGGSSGLATGGNGGSAGFFGFAGGDGGNVSAGSTVKCGGGGGGGGGGASGGGQTSGRGGDGGYPGGAGGGRGGFTTLGAPGSVGTGAAGVVWLFYK
jgi:hypothetical protein